MSYLAIVVVNYNTRNLLSTCLDSVRADLKRSDLAARIWVVDNGSSDGSAAMVRERFPEVQLLALTRNLGFAGASNAALREISDDTGPCTARAGPSPIAQYALLLNPDTTVQPGALKALAEFMDGDPAAGMAGPELRYPDGSFQHSAFRFPTLAQIFLDFFPLHYRLINSRLNGRYPRAWYESGEPFAIDHPLGAAMMVRWEAIQQVGLLDESFFMYCEEIDWCFRIRRAGWEVHCVPQAVVVHHEAQSTRQLADQMFVQLWRSRFRLFEKHYGSLFRWVARRLVWLGVAGEIVRARRGRSRGDLSPEAYERRLATLRQVRRI